MPIQTILVANRGEIAVRIFATAARMGRRTVAVYSEADRDWPHVGAADRAICIGPADPTASYLNIERLMEACRQGGADALHPGYGFLAESAALARACAAAGICFIGPSPEAIELMADKNAARARMQAAGLPCVPGAALDDAIGEGDGAAAIAAAQAVGFPLFIKAAAGGGGRGMRRVERAEELAEALLSARREALRGFGSGGLLLERVVSGARHVEVQVLADHHGRVVHLGERDCSVQRRHQKVIEETPCPVLSPAVRANMTEVAVAAARAVDYRGAGTVEFLLSPGGDFYFLEMNTRLQVEHAVTECVTGLDLVEWQIRVADDEPLPWAQSDIAARGHAIEARLYAEDPEAAFAPQTGRLHRWRAPAGVRVDAGVRAGLAITPHYDALLAKLIAHGRDRREAIERLVAALRQLEVLGVGTNRGLLERICQHPQFAAGDVTTTFLSEHPELAAAPAGDTTWAIAALLIVLAGHRARKPGDPPPGWSSGAPIAATVRLALGACERVAQVWRREGGRYAIALGAPISAPTAAPFDLDSSAATDIDLIDWTPGDPAPVVVVALAGVRERVPYAFGSEREVSFDREGAHRRVRDITHRAARRQGGISSGELLAPVDGAVARVAVTAGQALEAGALVAVLESMKMEHRITAGVAGVVDTVAVRPGDVVRAGQVVASLRPTAAAEGAVP